MNKIRENKVKFSLILISLGVLFSSLTILSLPALFNFNKKASIIEKNFYKNFKLYLNTSEYFIQAISKATLASRKFKNKFI